MGAVLDEILKAGFIGPVLADCGESVTYTPAGGAARTISAVVLRETRHRDEDAGTVTIEHDVMDVLISSQSDTEGALSPKEFGFAGQAGDTLTIDDETWYVARVTERNVAGLHRLRLSSKRLVRGRN